MYLKRLDIHGFKTFAQRATFVFPAGITAVIGPNGSGKSNVVDAVRWVLGEQSFANLRCKKTEDLIYGGGKGRPPMGFADVSLTIDNGDRLLDLPFDEVTIGRRAYRSGDNEYFINRSRVRLRELLDLVAPLGSSFTLINQGLVDAALALQPEDRQKLFEDAAEIGPFQAKKAEAERRLRETETNLLRLSDLLQEQEPRLRTLKRQARDADAAGAVEAELRALLVRHYRRLVAASRAALAAAVEAEHGGTAALEAARRQQAGAAGALEAARASIREQREALALLREAEADLQRRGAAGLRERAVIDERITGIRRQHDELRERERALHEAQATDRAELDAQRAASTRAEAELVEQRATFERREGAAVELFAARRQGETDLAAAQGELARRTAAAGAVDARHAQRVAHTATLERERLAFGNERGAASAALGAEQERLNLAEAALAAADQALREREAAVDVARHALEVARDAREAEHEALASARRDLADLEARFESLGRLIHSWEGAFPGVRAAMRWAAEQGIESFRLVASIVKAPAEIETAVEAALGSRLQQIVVDEWAAAEAAIAALKRGGAGRATFLPLDTIRPGRRLRPLTGPGVLGCAAEMVEYESRYAPVVDLLLGRTLIVTELPAARAALPRVESGALIVTLNGEQVSASGAVTGGSPAREVGRLRREREFRELSGLIESARAGVGGRQSALAAATARAEGAQDELRLAEAALHEAREHRGRQQAALETQRRQLHRAEDVLGGLVRRAERLEREWATTSGELERLGVELARARSSLDEARAAVEQAQAALRERRGAADVEEEALRLLRQSLAAAEAEQRARKEAYERRRRAEAAGAHELAEVGRRIAKLQGELNAAIRDLERLQAAGNELRAETQALAARLGPAEAALESAETRLEVLETTERAATGDVLAAERAHADVAIELQRVRSEHQILQERMAADELTPEALVDEALPEAGAPDEPANLPGRIEQVRARLRRMGPVNALAPGEYAALLERHTFLETQLADVRAAVITLREAITELEHLMDEQFHATFAAVAREFGAAFTRLFGGGAARLVLLGGEEANGNGASNARAARRGVDIVAQPPGKRQVHLQLLSGGERALTAAALLFAILKHQPRPFCIMDEVDAALDEANVVRFREALLELAADTQFILVTHNRGTVEVADTLYGISMGADGASRAVSLRFVESDAETVDLAAR